MLNALQQHQSELPRALIRQQGVYEKFSRKIKFSSKISPQLALDIYRNNTGGARASALEIIYPVCKKIVGESVFRLITKEYIIADTVGSGDLNHYGKIFNQHLKRLLRSGRLPEEYAYLSDLARLEYIIHAAYYADDDTEFDFKLFAQKVNKDKPVYFKTSASLGLLKSEYPIYEIWLNNQKQQGYENVNAIKNTQYLLVHRKKFKPVVNPVNKNEYLLIDAFINNFSFQQIIENFEFNIDVVLPKLIKNKWLSGIK